jgi:hypothetical protein
MNLIDTYIEQVGDNLPGKDREDIKKEIRSILEDTLENRSLSAGRAVDEAMTVEVLKEFGTPKKVAAAYLPPRYLIGPRLYPTFLMAIKFVLGIIVLVVVVTTSVALFQQPYTIQTGTDFVIKKLMELAGSLLSVFGNLVFVFALVEWALAHAKSENEETWDPRSLTGEDNNDIVKPWSLVPGIILTAIALLIFNVFARQFGTYFNDSTNMQVFIPALSPVFFTYLPWLNLIWVLGLGLNFALIRTGKWQPWSKWFQMGLDVLTVILLILMVTGRSIITDAAEKLVQMGPTGEQIAGIQSAFGIGAKALLIVLIVVTVIDLVENGIKLIRKK